jgi:Rrf2 family protein
VQSKPTADTLLPKLKQEARLQWLQYDWVSHVHPLMHLRRCGIVRSQRGVKGGYQLGKAPDEITMLEILTCLEGSGIQEQNEQTQSATMENMMIQEVWQEAAKAAMAVFGGYTLKDLYEKQQERKRFHPMYYI